MSDIQTELNRRIEELKNEIQASQRALEELIRLRSFERAVSAKPSPAVVKAKPVEPVETKVEPKAKAAPRVPKYHRGQADTTNELLTTLERYGERGRTAKQLAHEMKRNYNTISSRCSTLTRDGVINHVGQTYVFKKPTPSKDITDSMVVHSAAARP